MTEATREARELLHEFLRGKTGTRCPIQDPRWCLGTRCQLIGRCDFNRQLDEGKLQ